MKINIFTRLIILISLLATGCQTTERPVSSQPAPLPVPTLPSAKPIEQPIPTNIQSPQPVIAPADIPAVKPPSPDKLSEPVESKNTIQPNKNDQAEGKLDPPTVCEINTVKVKDPNPPLNIRSAPNTTSSEVLAKADNGQYLSVKGEQNGWLKIAYNYGEPIEGWVAKNRTESSCNLKEQHITLPSAGGNINISDRIIGG
ncbi:MAG: SH3 domain-containing protein, partial [Microcoleaceae cyanobacterium]